MPVIGEMTKKYFGLERYAQPVSMGYIKKPPFYRGFTFYA